MLRGWVNYFRAGHSSECFGYVKDWVEKKIRRHMLRARKRQGFGWTRWSRDWLYEPSIGAVGRFNRRVAGRIQQAVLQAAEMRVDDENFTDKVVLKFVLRVAFALFRDIIESIATRVGAARPKDQGDNVVALQITCMFRVLLRFQHFNVEVVRR